MVIDDTIVGLMNDFNNATDETIGLFPKLIQVLVRYDDILVSESNMDDIADRAIQLNLGSTDGRQSASARFAGKGVSYLNSQGAVIPQPGFYWSQFSDQEHESYFFISDDSQLAIWTGGGAIREEYVYPSVHSDTTTAGTVLQATDADFRAHTALKYFKPSQLLLDSIRARGFLRAAQVMDENFTAPADITPFAYNGNHVKIVVIGGGGEGGHRIGHTGNWIGGGGSGASGQVVELDIPLKHLSGNTAAMQIRSVTVGTGGGNGSPRTGTSRNYPGRSGGDTHLNLSVRLSVVKALDLYRYVVFSDYTNNFPTDDDDFVNVRISAAGGGGGGGGGGYHPNPISGRGDGLDLPNDGLTIGRLYLANGMVFSTSAPGRLNFGVTPSRFLCNGGGGGSCRPYIPGETAPTQVPGATFNLETLASTSSPLLNSPFRDNYDVAMTSKLQQGPLEALPGQGGVGANPNPLASNNLIQTPTLMNHLNYFKGVNGGGDGGLGGRWSRNNLASFLGPGRSGYGYGDGGTGGPVFRIGSEELPQQWHPNNDTVTTFTVGGVLLRSTNLPHIVPAQYQKFYRGQPGRNGAVLIIVS